MIDEEPRFLRQCRRNIKDPETLELTLQYYEFSKRIAPYRDWGTQPAGHLSSRVYMPLGDDSGGAVFSVRTDAVVQIWPNEIVRRAPKNISRWFIGEVDTWPELAGKGEQAPLFHLEREFNSSENFERFERVFTELKKRLEA